MLKNIHPHARVAAVALVTVWALSLAGSVAFVFGAIAAPVPKSPPPAPLTADQLVGYWTYEWGQWPDGVICFERDGSYSAVHDHTNGISYAGTWTVDGNVVTIVEWSFDRGTGERRGGPATYRFDFAQTKCPSLSGLSNGSEKVTLTNPKK